MVLYWNTVCTAPVTWNVRLAGEVGVTGVVVDVLEPQEVSSSGRARRQGASLTESEVIGRMVVSGKT